MLVGCCFCVCFFLCLCLCLVFGISISVPISILISNLNLEFRTIKMDNALHSAVFDVREVRVFVLRVCVLRVCVVCERDKRMESRGWRGRVVSLLRMCVCVSDIFTWTKSVSVSVLLVAVCAVLECNVSVWCSL